MMRQSLFALVLLMSSLSLATAWSSGSGTCNADAASVNSKTGRHPITPYLGFYLDLPTQYSPGQQYTITVLHGGNQSAVTGFNGFLLYAIDSTGARQGSWTSVLGLATTNIQNAGEADNGVCGNAPGSTLTHDVGGIKPVGTQFTWTAPTSDVGSLAFMGLIEWTSTLYYTQVLSPWWVCNQSNNTCTKFDPTTVLNGTLPQPPPGSSSPFGLQPIDQTACGDFDPIVGAAVPPGYCASIYAGGLNRPRGIYVTKFGDLLVLEAGSGLISVLRDLNGNGVIDRSEPGEYSVIFRSPGLNHALYVKNGWLYTGNATTILRMPFNDTAPLSPLGPVEILVKNIPNGGHTTRTVLIGHEGRWLYVSVGSAGNLDNDDSRSRVIRYDLNATVPLGGWRWNNYSDPVQAFGLGLRNEVGIINDLQGDVWGAMNADDNLNRPDLGGLPIHNDNPAEQLHHFTEARMSVWHGYPFCWVVDILANNSRGTIYAWGGDGKDWWKDGVHTDDWCRNNTFPPAYAMQAHTAPLGLLFYDGKGKYAFGPEYYNSVFVALHGSWNSDTPRGYKVITIQTDQYGEAIPETARSFFAYQGPGETANGWYRPVDPKVGVNGELFVSSDSPGSIIVVRKLNARGRPVLAPQVAVAGTNYSIVGGPTVAVTDFSFDRQPASSSFPAFTWREGSREHDGLAQFDGRAEYINATAADNGAGAAVANLTGGPLTLEVWIRPSRYDQSDSSTVQVLIESIQPADNQSVSVGDLFNLGLTGIDSAAQRASISFITKRDDGNAQSMKWDASVPSEAWTHIVVTSDGNQTAVLYVNGTIFDVANQALLPQLRHRRIAYIGRSHLLSLHGSIFAYYSGLIDDFRIYSYPLSNAQVAVNYLSTYSGKISPVIYGHFAVTPMESTEPTFAHLGVANRHIKPALASDLFPGYANFDGQSQYINLTNPANGVAAVLSVDTIKTEFTIEFWLRYPSNTVTIPTVLLNVHEMFSVAHIDYSNPALLTFFMNSNLGGYSQFNLSAPLGSMVGQWTHLVWTGIGVAGDRDHVQHIVYINGNATQSFITEALNPDIPVSYGYLGAGWNVSSKSLFGYYAGDIGGFRMYDCALSDELVRFHWAAELNVSMTLNNHVPVSGSSSSSSSSGGNSATSSSSGGASSSGVEFSSSSSSTNSSSGGDDAGTKSTTVGWTILFIALGGIALAVAIYAVRVVMKRRKQAHRPDGDNMSEQLLETF